MKRMFSILLLAIATLSAGCSDIGKINGVDISRVAGGNPNASYCQLNPGTCIIGAAIAVGGTAAIIHHATKDSNTPPPPLPGSG